MEKCPYNFFSWFALKLIKRSNLRFINVIWHILFFFLNLYHVHNSNSVLLSTAMPQFTHAYENNRFLLLWRYNDQTDKIFYHVRVKTTGWVGFGFAETAPNNMMNYDVIVGGFSNGQGYLFVSFLPVGHYSNRSAACLFSFFSTI